MTQDALNRAIGKALAERRRASEKRQVDIAQLCGISRSSLANIEKGRQSLSLHMLYQVAEALGVDDPRTLLPKGLPTDRHQTKTTSTVPIGRSSQTLSAEELAEVTAVVSMTVR